ncbi:MAG: hypothetical protein R2741_15100 [Methanolobus sp.]
MDENTKRLFKVRKIQKHKNLSSREQKATSTSVWMTTGGVQEVFRVSSA